MQIPVKVPEALRDRLTIVCINGKNMSACSTTRSGGTLSAATRSFGDFAIRLDTVPPTVKPINFTDGKAFSGSEIKVRVTDDLSGINTYHCYINGEWVLAEHDGKTTSLIVAAASLRKGNNEVRCVVTDVVGNRTEQVWTVKKP